MCLVVLQHNPKSLRVFVFEQYKCIYIPQTKWLLVKLDCNTKFIMYVCGLNELITMRQQCVVTKSFFFNYDFPRVINWIISIWNGSLWSILQVGFLTLLLSELNVLSLSLSTFSRHLNSAAIFLPLSRSTPLLPYIQSEDEELGGHRWREVLCLFQYLLAEWKSLQMGLYWKPTTNLQRNIKL